MAKTHRRALTLIIMIIKMQFKDHRRARTKQYLLQDIPMVVHSVAISRPFRRALRYFLAMRRAFGSLPTRPLLEQSNAGEPAKLHVNCGLTEKSPSHFSGSLIHAYGAIWNNPRDISCKPGNRKCNKPPEQMLGRFACENKRDARWTPALVHSASRPVSMVSRGSRNSLGITRISLHPICSSASAVRHGGVMSSNCAQ